MIGVMRNLLRCGAATVLVAVLAGLAGCDSGGGHPSTSASASSGAMSDEQILAVGREFAQCMGEHGLEVEEPTIDNGRLLVPFPQSTPQQGTPAPKPETPEACRSILERLPESVLQAPPPSAEDMEKMEAFSECVRQNGFPDWPNPQPNGRFVITGTSIDIKSDAWQAAKRACQKHYDGQIRVSAP